MQTTIDISKLDNYQKADLVEKPSQQALRIMGYTVNNHATNDGGVDVVATKNGCKILCEVNHYTKPNSFFKEATILKTDTNLVYGYEYVNAEVGYIQHSDVSYRLHICVGVNRNTYQQSDADALGIHVIYFSKLPTLRQLIDKISSVIHHNPYNKSYKVSCNGDNHLNNDKSGMELSSNISPIVSLNCSSSTENSKEPTEQAPSNNNSSQTNDKSKDIGLESSDTTQELMDTISDGELDLIASLSYTRKMEYALTWTDGISKDYELKIPKLPSGIQKELCLAQYQAVKLVSATLGAKILKMDKISKNAYVR